jgi:DNA-binding CsgD family transcriptional regulator
MTFLRRSSFRPQVAVDSLATMEPQRYNHHEVLALVSLAAELLDRDRVRHIGTLLSRVMAHFRADPVAAAEIQGHKVSQFASWGHSHLRDQLCKAAIRIAQNPNTVLDENIIASKVFLPRRQLSLLLLGVNAGSFSGAVSDSLQIVHSSIQPRLAELQQPSLHTLSPRLSQVLEGLIDGQSDKEIATRLGISHETVHVYVKNLFKLRGVHSRAELLSNMLKASKQSVSGIPPSQPFGSHSMQIGVETCGLLMNPAAMATG